MKKNTYFQLNDLMAERMNIKLVRMSGLVLSMSGNNVSQLG